MKKVFAICLAVLSAFLVVAVAMASDEMGKAETVKGWVSDSKCGAKGASAEPADCTKKCLEEGREMVIVTDKDQ